MLAAACARARAWVASPLGTPRSAAAAKAAVEERRRVEREAAAARRREEEANARRYSLAWEPCAGRAKRRKAKASSEALTEALTEAHTANTARTPPTHTANTAHTAKRARLEQNMDFGALRYVASIERLYSPRRVSRVLYQRTQTTAYSVQRTDYSVHGLWRVTLRCVY
jgi:hypothetical protein